MKYAIVILACLCTPCVAQELPVPNAEAQAQIQRTFDTMNRLKVVDYDSVEVFQEAQKVKELLKNDDEIVGQLACFVASKESSENTHVLLSLIIWKYLNVSPVATIRVLAPYLESSNEPLKDFAEEWLRGHNNFDDFKMYARRQKEVPVAFVNLVYRRSPSEALEVFQAGSVDVAAHVRIAREKLERTGDKKLSLLELSEKRKAEGRREALLAEHVVANAIWFKRKGFDEQFRSALPQAQEELRRLSESEEWWARRYALEIMLRHPELCDKAVLKTLENDAHKYVGQHYDGSASDAVRSRPK